MGFLLTRKGKGILGNSFLVPQVVESFITEDIEQCQVVQEKREEVAG